MKLLQANIWGGRLSNVLTDFISSESADILCLQEVVDTKGYALIFTTVDDIKKESGYSHDFFSPVFDFNLLQKQAEFGNAIITKNYTKPQSLRQLTLFKLEVCV